MSVDELTWFTPWFPMTFPVNYDVKYVVQVSSSGEVQFYKLL